MVKTLVIYFSKYGTTKKYAEIISKELGCEIFSINNFGSSDYVVEGKRFKFPR